MAIHPRPAARGLAWLALSAATLLAAAPLRAGDYLLGPEDRVRLKVFEWRASKDEIFSWSALNDEYTIGPEGELSLPLVGQVDAGGRTRGELAALVGDQLATRMGLSRRPTVAVDVVTYRPFYIVGPVARPGAYPYRPGLTLLKAVGLAGGLGSRADLSDRLRTDVVAREGDLVLIGLERDGALMRRARLMAELAGAETIAVPEELRARRGERAVAGLLDQETAIFAARLDAYRTQMQVLEQLHDHLVTEVPTQEALLETVKVQSKTLHDELDTVNGVIGSDQTRARRLGLERAIAQLQGEELRAQADLLRARQEVNRSELSIVELRTQRGEAIAAELRAVQADLDQLGERAETTRALIDEAAVSDPYSAAPGARRLEPVYTILRDRDGRTDVLPAEESTAIEPGDAIRIELRRSDSGIAPASTCTGAACPS